MNTLEKLQKHLNTPIKNIRGYEYKEKAELVRCKDGSTLSVQASENHYCEPRINVGPYTEVEVWLCGEVDAWAEYGDGTDPYAYLPIELVVQEIDRRGGFAD